MASARRFKFDEEAIYSSLFTLGDAVAQQRSATLEYCGKPRRWFSGWALLRITPITVFFDTLLELNSLWNYRRSDGLVDEPETKSWPWLELFVLLFDIVPCSTIILGWGDVPIANACAVIYLQAVVVHAIHRRVVGKRFSKGRRATAAYRCLLAAHMLFFHMMIVALHAARPFGMDDVYEAINNLVTLNLGKVDWLVRSLLQKLVMPHLSYRWTSSVQYLLVQLYFIHNRTDYGLLEQYDPKIVQILLKHTIVESAWSALEGLIWVTLLQVCAFAVWWMLSMLRWMLSMLWRLFSSKTGKAHAE